MPGEGFWLQDIVTEQARTVATTVRFKDAAIMVTQDTTSKARRRAVVSAPLGVMFILHLSNRTDASARLRYDPFDFNGCGSLPLFSAPFERKRVTIGASHHCTSLPRRAIQPKGPPPGGGYHWLELTTH